MAKYPKTEGAQFVRYFGPLLEALRSLGGSGTPDEVVARIAKDLEIPDEVQNELLDSGGPRYKNQVGGPGSIWCGKATSIPARGAFGASLKSASNSD